MNQSIVVFVLRNHDWHQKGSRTKGKSKKGKRSRYNK